MKLKFVAYINIENGRIARLSFPQAKIDDEGLIETEDSVLKVVHVYEHTLPPNCNQMSYFMEYYWYDLEEEDFKFTGLPPNNHASWNFQSQEWEWNQEDLINEVRKVRNRILSATDWTQALDAPLSESQLQSWRTYRQQLRDVTSDLSSISSVSEVNWPEKPL